MPFKPVPNEMLDSRKAPDTFHTTPAARKVSSDLPINVNLVVKDSEQYCPKHQPASEDYVKTLKGQVLCLQSQLRRLTKELAVVKKIAEQDSVLDGDSLILELRKHFVSK